MLLNFWVSPLWSSGNWPLNVFVSPLLRLRARGWIILLARHRTLDILRRSTSLFRCSLFFLLRVYQLGFSLLCRRSLHRLFLIVLPHHGVARLVTVILLLKLMLLFYLSRISIP